MPRFMLVTDTCMSVITKAEWRYGVEVSTRRAMGSASGASGLWKANE